MRIIFSLLPVLLLAACTGSGSRKTVQDTAQKPKAADTVVKKHKSGPSVPADEKLTAFARFIAGMPNNSGFKAIGDSAWIRYGQQNAAKWTELQAKIGDPIRSWVKEASLGREGEPGTLFYPFAGGDYYYAHLFFPRQDTVVMIGLEPGGSVFNPDTMNSAGLQTYYNGLQHSMFFPHRLGFFRTKSMAVDFNKGPLNGTLHTVLFYLARFGAEIHYIRHFDLDAGGREINVLEAKDRRRGAVRMGYRVGYSLPGSNSVKEVIYFSYDASNQNLKAKPNLLNWLNSRGRVVTFFKAASYLMHYDMFSTMRDFVNRRTVRLLQDDSGLPYKFMLSNGFDVKLLGRYTRTIALFKKEFQPDMKEAYEKAEPAKLPFLIGYNAEFKECNMQAATKKP